ncbi:MAG: transposase family protein [candidate division KSB1 bacterium]|nr:transposase family protein [candidate division KSB1 bacterium]
MTRRSIIEYAEELKKRYYGASRKEKGKMLDEFTRITGLHRKAAIRLLHRLGQPRAGKRRGRPAVYQELTAPLRVVWEACDRLCSKRLQPFLPEMIRVLREHGEQQIDASMAAQLSKMSPSTIDRLLRPYRKGGGRRGRTTTRAGSLLKSSIPVRTFADWQENRPGFMETDLVAHCGESAEGFYLNTLCAVDVATGWTECLPVWGKGQERVKTAVHRMRQSLPFPLLGVDSDNGSEFINQCFNAYCRQNTITFTRSRAYKKNDSCHVEQKNGNVVRRLVGYDRYTSKEAYRCLERLYHLVRLYINFFQPTMKLVSKTRHGAKVTKVYDTARTPYQRLLETGVLTEAKRQELAATYSGLNPVHLLKQINNNLEQLWQMAMHPASLGNRNYDAIRSLR